MSKTSLLLSVLIHAGALAGVAWFDSSGVAIPPLAGGRGEGSFEVGVRIEDGSLSEADKQEAPVFPQEGGSSSVPAQLGSYAPVELSQAPGPTRPLPGSPAAVEDQPIPREQEEGGPGTEAPRIEDPSALRPVYPMSCRRLRHQGVVVVRVLVGANGAVIEAEVKTSAGCPDLDQAAVLAVSKARFKPARSWGKPVKAVVEQSFKFELRR